MDFRRKKIDFPKEKNGFPVREKMDFPKKLLGTISDKFENL